MDHQSQKFKTQLDNTKAYLSFQVEQHIQATNAMVVSI